MVTEQTKSFNTWRAEPSRGYQGSNSYQNKAAVRGISTDIERSRSFARTLRQSEHRWWTAKYDNAPRFTGQEKSRRGLQSSLLSQSAPDLSQEDLLEHRQARPARAGSLSTKPLTGPPRRSLGRTSSVAGSSELGVRRQLGSQLELTSWPVTVKTIALQDRPGDIRGDKVKIRYPGSRSSSRPKLRHKINLQMKKEELEG